MPCAPQWIDTKALLARVPLFDGMTPSELARVAGGAREMHTARGEVLFRKDDPCNGLYLLVYGRVKLAFVTPQGGEKILEILDQGATFCESTMFLGEKYQVYAQTLTDCLLLFIGKPVLMAELVEAPALAHRVIDVLSRRLHDLSSDIESYSLHSGRQRVVRFLLREGRATPPESGDRRCAGEEGGAQLSMSVSLLVNKSHVASRLNLTQEHFSRILHELVGDGLLLVDGREILLRDVDRLRQEA